MPLGSRQKSSSVKFADVDLLTSCHHQRPLDMKLELEPPADEIKRLQRCINDLISVLALPAIWSGRGPAEIVRDLLHALLGMLRLDLVYVRLKDPDGEAPVQLVRVAQSQAGMAREGETCELLYRWFGDNPLTWSSPLRKLISGRDISLLPLRLGLHGELGLIVAGSQRANFPSEIEKLVLSVAANQASLGLQEARLLNQQKRISSELDQQVAQRTAKLAETNEELRKEILDRTRAEEALQASERELDLIVNTIPALAWSARPDGSAEFFNQHYLAYVGLPLEQLQGPGWTVAVHPDDMGALIAAWQAMMATGKAGEIEGRLRRSDGVYRWFLFRANPMLDEAGNILKWY